MHRADYEIYTFKRGDTKYWAFDVEYFGHYVAKSENEILDKVAAVKIRVANRLKEIERLNTEYYERLNRETEEMLAAIKEYKAFKEEQSKKLLEKPDKREILQQVRDMLLMGATYQEVLEAVPDANLRVISHVKSHLVAKNLL